MIKEIKKTTMDEKEMTNDRIELAADLFDSEQHLISAFDSLTNENARWACIFLLWACESHERKAA